MSVSVAIIIWHVLKLRKLTLNLLLQNYASQKKGISQITHIEARMM